MKGFTVVNGGSLVATGGPVPESGPKQVKGNASAQNKLRSSAVARTCVSNKRQDANAVRVSTEESRERVLTIGDFFGYRGCSKETWTKLETHGQGSTPGTKRAGHAIQPTLFWLHFLAHTHSIFSACLTLNIWGTGSPPTADSQSEPNQHLRLALESCWLRKSRLLDQLPLGYSSL